MSVSEKIFGKKDLARLIFSLMIELALTLLVGMIDSATGFLGQWFSA